MKTRKILALLLALVMVLGLCGTAFAAHLTDEVTELETQNSDASEYIAEQSYVLLENNGVLPIAKSGKLALFGSAAETTIKGGTGSGDVNQRAHDNIGAAFEAAGYEIANPTWFARMAAQPQPSGCMGSSPKNDLEITDEELAEAVANTDTAIYCIARNAGEFSDREIASGAGAYKLTAVELANMAKISASFENVILVYNTLVMDTGWQSDYDIDAVVFMGNGGQRGSEALVKILNGDVTPSGKLTDTWALDINDYPSTSGFANLDGNTNTEWYSEGIYVGYRYFDTFGKEVKYPFGFGLSYTDFKIEVVDVTANASEVTVTAKVTNIGETYSGKEVVQVYFSAPSGSLEKPYQELAAYAKTDELAPLEQQILTISFATTDMSSYSEARAAYVMEAGNYIIRVGNSSRNTKAAAVISLNRQVITEQMYNQLALEDGAVLDELSNKGATPIANNDAAELASAKRISLRSNNFKTVDYRSNINNDETITTYLFAADAANYKARDEITLKTKTVAGIINNASNPSGSGNRFNGYSTTTYKEVVEIVPDLPEGITKANAKLTDVFEGKITLEQFLACLDAYELSRIAVGGATGVEQPEEGPIIGAQASKVQGGAGQTTDQYYLTRHIPSMPNADGPAGVRISQHYTQNGTDYYQFCTAFPVGTNIAQTWDTAVYEKFGKAVGSEMVEYGVTTWLAPGMDMHRNPLNGRNFEYYSEDPLVAGLTAAYTTIGVQSYPGIGVTLKHFFGNEQESNRNALDNVISERAAREIYLKQFEIAVRLAQPQCMMNCYNENNGWPGSDSWDLNEDILRGEWGFQGAVMTDWGGGQSSPHISMHGGCDMIMSGGNGKLNDVRNNFFATDPTFNEDGTIKNPGLFVVKAGGDPLYTVPTNAPTENDLPESLKEAIAAEEAEYDKIGSNAVIIWYGEMNMYNKICLGDLQKSAKHILGNALISQDMVKLYADVLNKTVEIPTVSAKREAPLANGYATVEKSEVATVGAVVAAKVEADCITEKTVDVPVTYRGEGALSSERLYISCDVPIKEIKSQYDFEYNPADGRVIVYQLDGAAIGTDLFTITFDLSNIVADGEYPVVLTHIEATDAEGALTVPVTIDGAIIIDNSYPKGDVTQDGEMTNADLILIARYLVGLVEFNEKQLEAADYNEDGIVDNRDLVLIARALVVA